MATFQRGGSKVILGYKTGSRALQKVYSPEVQGKCFKKSQGRDVCVLGHLVSVTRAGVSGRSESSRGEGMSPYCPSDGGGGVVRWAGTGGCRAPHRYDLGHVSATEKSRAQEQNRETEKERDKLK